MDQKLLVSNACVCPPPSECSTRSAALDPRAARASVQQVDLDPRIADGFPCFCFRQSCKVTVDEEHDLRFRVLSFVEFVSPSLATHYVWTQLKAGNTVY